MVFFPQVSLLITHYNRSHSLQNLLQRFRQLDCVFGQIVVSDDGSKAEHAKNLLELQKEYGFLLVTAPTNRGLGNNLNKGQDAVNKPFTLYIQEDFEPADLFPTAFAEALVIMENRTELDIVKFYAYYPYAYLKSYNENFDEMYVPALAADYRKIYFYTDHPHLRRSAFFTKFGRYPEGIKGDATEYSMCISFLQHKGKGLFYKDFANLLSQKNSAEEPSTMQRENWKQRNGLLINMIRYVYRQIKYNFDIVTQKPLKQMP
ncbi:glycosyltransferase [Pedobacter frigidisoli]|uniref:glycosyltransferase n=1 Tax=Pedobacter frigidisoli TaxID=2530455 RepID=UPI002931DFB4|nr:glycosyltransferase [Pedobacter frigidisoli]